MKIAYHAVNFTLLPHHQEQIRKELTLIEAALRNFSEPVARVSIEKSARKGGLGVGLKVVLPTRTLFATAWGGDIRTAVEVAAGKVLRQAKRHLDMLRREERAGARSLRRPSVPAPASAEDLAELRDLEDFRDHIAEHAAQLHDILLRERHLDPRARKAGGRVSVPDVVEEALVYVFQHFRERPKQLAPDRWLVRRGLLFLDEEIERALREPTEALPELEEAEDWEDWEELLELNRLFPKLSPLEGREAQASRASPELLGDRREAQHATEEALGKLKDRQRQALLLHHLEGYQQDEIAYVLNTSEGQVEDWLLQAEVVLRERLADWRGI